MGVFVWHARVLVRPHQFRSFILRRLVQTSLILKVHLLQGIPKGPCLFSLLASLLVFLVIGDRGVW
jgi:hypothetical protein